MDTWKTICDEAASVLGEDPVVARAYSEFMPAPYLALKPYLAGQLGLPAQDGSTFAVTEYEEAEELAPGLAKISRHLLHELYQLRAGHTHELSHALLKDNAAWPADLAAAAPSLSDRPIVICLALALSRTQDDKGRVRWTLFGTSHRGPGWAFWRSFGPKDQASFCRTVEFLTGIKAESIGALREAGLRILPRAPEALPAFAEAGPPAFAAPLLCGRDEIPRALLTFEAFGRLPDAVRAAYIRGELRIVPSPASLIFFEHPRYRELDLPWAVQIPLLQVFPRSESTYALRIPQSGWLDEHRAGEGRLGGHRMVRNVVRTHRWQRHARDAELAADAFADHMTVALFSNDPDELGLYGKPMARNAQVWTSDYRKVLDGPSASSEEIQRAAEAVRAGGRFGYRFLFPPMRAGARSLFWHRPLLARLDPRSDALELCPDAPLGSFTAELAGQSALELSARLLAREGHRDAAWAFNHDPGHLRRTTSFNARKLLEWSEMLGGRLAPSMALRLLDVARDTSLESWLEQLPGRAQDPRVGERAAAALRRRIGASLSLERTGEGAPVSRTFDKTRVRTFEERLWQVIASLAEGEFRDKDNADVVASNAGRKGGELGAALGRAAAHERDLDRLAEYLHRAYKKKITRHSMSGRAFVADQRFSWQTDFDFSWSGGWKANREAKSERNVVVVIPGRNPAEAVVMADHYDTAYMEDLYEPGRGGDKLRASASGADDNHSATATLLAAAEVLLPLARDGKLERSVWLVHLTGEEFPSDCLGARALARALVRGDLSLTRPGGEVLDVRGTRVTGVYVLDMIGHNNDRVRDVFQIAPGEGVGSARLAEIAHLANERWNHSVPAWNRSPERHGRGRAQRLKTGITIPPIAEHLALRGEVRTEWEPRSALYNTDGQIFSDVGVPVVLFMENYDINRTGYHDTHDTMKNIDLDYCAALSAIAIESVAEAACAKTLR